MALKLIALAAVAATMWHRHKNRQQEQSRLHQDRQLDEALDESFPASDSPSITPQRRSIESPL